MLEFELTHLANFWDILPHFWYIIILRYISLPLNYVTLLNSLPKLALFNFIASHYFALSITAGNFTIFSSFPKSHTTVACSHTFTKRTNTEVSSFPSRTVFTRLPVKTSQTEMCPLKKKKEGFQVKNNPLHLHIMMHVFHTVLCTYLKPLTKRICWTIKSFFTWWLMSDPGVQRV